jgi:hypothetical protein
MEASLRNVLRTPLLLTIAAVFGVALGGLPFAFQPSWSPLPNESQAQNSSSFNQQSRAVRLSGEVLRGQTWGKEARQDLFFRLMPDELGWTILLRSGKESDHNFASVVTPPYRGVNPISIQGWHFRNSDNSGPNEAGPKNVNAPQEVREFEFVLNDASYQQAFDALQKMLWSYSYSPREVALAEELHERLKKGKGILTIQEMRLNNLEMGKQAGMDWMRFEVELVLPPD